MNYVKNCYYSCKEYLSPLGELYEKAQKEISSLQSELAASQLESQQHKDNNEALKMEIEQLKKEKQQVQMQLKKVQTDLNFKVVECAKLSKLYETKKSVESVSAKVASRNDIMRTIISDHEGLLQENASLKHALNRSEQERSTLKSANAFLKLAVNHSEQERLTLERANAALMANTFQDSHSTPGNVLPAIENIPPPGNVLAAIENTPPGPSLQADAEQRKRSNSRQAPVKKLAASSSKVLPRSAVVSTQITQPSASIRRPGNIQNLHLQQHHNVHQMEAVTPKRQREQDEEEEEEEDEHGNSTKRLKAVAH